LKKKKKNRKYPQNITDYNPTKLYHLEYLESQEKIKYPLNHKEYQIIDYDYRKEFMKWCNSNIGQNCHNMNLENSYKEPIEVVLDCFMKNIIIPYSKINSTPVIKVEPDENKPSYNNKNIINEEYNTIQLDNTTTKLISSSEPKRIYIDYNLSKSTIPFEEKEKDKKNGW